MRIVESAGFGGKPDFPVGGMAVDDDLRAVGEFKFQHWPIEIAFDVCAAGVYGLLDAVKHCIGQFVEFVFRHIIPPV